ncbi:uncharacterized protein BJ212DRAFT_1365151 [Suillus subaureus]|uniref:Uncharacterized protein n=1 Tax=Suillus subaureus TaxID=48587 RepID=A0A9P7E8G6_9AGAM|nr:uncharacterized protein BJ212DRAFT_1365151 [Suillus subaureus]KAG1814018.1 hypothetical protein BJ212DRAFT_1365151 [Suillus subaureus]
MMGIWVRIPPLYIYTFQAAAHHATMSMALLTCQVKLTWACCACRGCGATSARCM